jgi:hypothetical protein
MNLPFDRYLKVTFQIQNANSIIIEFINSRPLEIKTDVSMGLILTFLTSPPKVNPISNLINPLIPDSRIRVTSLNPQKWILVPSSSVEFA